MGFEYKDIKKDIFIDGHKRSNVVKDCKRFLNKIEELKPYLVKFNEDGIIKDKTYILNYVIKSGDCQSVIIVTDNQCTFLANDGIYKVWTRVRNTFLHSKSQVQGIMMSKFLLSFGYLNLVLLSEEKQ